jgi:hypothetical protein
VSTPENSSPQLGSDAYSWAYDGCTSSNNNCVTILVVCFVLFKKPCACIVYYNSRREQYGSGDVRRGDVIGVGVDYDQRCFQFWKNGVCVSSVAKTTNFVYSTVDDVLFVFM